MYWNSGFDVSKLGPFWKKETNEEEERNPQIKVKPEFVDRSTNLFDRSNVDRSTKKFDRSKNPQKSIFLQIFQK